VGIPLVMHEPPRANINAALARLKLVFAGVLRLRPTYILALRVVLAYAVSKLDYVYDAIPPSHPRLDVVQHSVDRVLTCALRLPRNVPRALLYAPLAVGGYGVPHLTSRFRLRFVAGIMRALNSRNALVRTSTRWLLQHPSAAAVRHSDMSYFSTTLQHFQLTASLPPHPHLVNCSEAHHHVRTWAGEPVILMSDGSVTATAVGWGAVVTDSTGILPTACGGFACHYGTSWAAEWLGKVAAVRLALQLCIPQTHLRWAIADNISATHGSDGGRPSRCPWIDELRIWYAAILAKSELCEGYTPAEHDYHGQSLAACLQAASRDLATQGAVNAQSRSLPSADLLGDTAVLCVKGDVVLDLSRLWQHLYNSEHLPDPGPVPVKYPGHDQSA
jgi:hypothetical protein